MRSMTGIGKGSTILPGTSSKVDVEIRSHNHRFLEVSVKCPTTLLIYENFIKKKAVESLTRGYVVVSIQMEDEINKYKVEVDHGLLTRIVNLRNEITKKYRIKDNLSLDTIFKLPGIVKFVRGEISAKKIYSSLGKAIDYALKDLIRSKRTEGRNISKSIKKSMRKIRNSLKLVEKRAPLRRKEKRRRLDKLLADAMIKATPKKMAEEILYYVDRLDITEECSRIKSHLNQLSNAIKNTAPGRKLNFLSQELYRETNTIAAKAYDAKISELVVNIKEEIEKIREQVQNVE